MKLTAVLLIVFGLHVGAAGISQTITFKGTNVPLRQAFITIEKQTGFVLLYNPDKLKTKRVTINSSSMPLTDFLQEILKGQGLSYLIKDKTIFIRTSPVSSSVFPPFPAEKLEPPVTVKGKVTDEKGEPVEGVYVTVKGTDKTTTTDLKGEFLLSGVDENATLVFTSVNTDAQEVAVDGRTVLTVVLHRRIYSMSDVVVVGYGTQSRRNVTGSVSKIDMEDTRKLPNTNISQAFRGKVAGVQFTDGGRPGQNGTILIRGPRSLSGGNSPLIVLDGIFFNGTIANINPNDIASIEILKDASAAAIYGSRAANGVILITSKRGTTEKPVINVNAYSGVTGWSYRPKLLSPERYIQKTLDARLQNGMEANRADIDKYLTTSEAENYKNDKVTDPWDMVSQDGRINSVDLSISGKTDRTNYFISGAFLKEKGIILKDDQRRISLRMNIENKVSKNITIGTHAFFSSRDLSGVSPSMSSAITASPYGNWLYDDGEPTQYYVVEDGYQVNAIRSSLLKKDLDIYENLIANLYTDINLAFIDGLSFRLNYSPNYRWERYNTFMRQDQHVPDVNNRTATKYNRLAFDWVVENILTYKKQINKNSRIEATLLYGANKFEWENTNAQAEFLPNDEAGWNNLALGQKLTNTSDAASTQGVSSMARINYQLMNKYLFTLTARRDGSSVFGAERKFATFPSAAFGWIISDESFARNYNFINMIKLRLSYGAVGNQAISPYESLARVGSTFYVFGDGSPYSVGSIPLSMANSQLQWETTYSTNAAIDFSLFKRINGTVEWYYLKTKDLLISRSLPHSTGFISTLTNLGGTSNKGIEVSLSSVNIKSRDFQWTTDVVFSYNKNKITSLYGIDNDKNGREDDDIANKWFIGQPIDVAYDYVFDGIYQETESGHKAGDVKLKDLNGDGQIDPQNDRMVLGQTGQPKYRWGVTNSLQYRKLSLSVFVNVMQGWQKSISYFRSVLRPQNMFDYEWWTPENGSNSSPSFTYQNPLGHGYYKSRDFVRIQDISLSYDLTGLSLLSKAGIRNANIWLSGKNLFTFTKWPGMDPENGNSYDGFPMIKTMSAGLSFSF